MKIDLRDQYETKNSYGTKMKPLNKLRDHLYNLAKLLPPGVCPLSYTN
jgi:hypothetical protein